jgi:DNA-binding Lrp family transcriptional regulator
MKLNPIEEQILSIIKQDIAKSKADYSTLTNNEIAEKIGISVFSIRDKVLKMSKKKVITKRNNFWTTDMKYHNRVIYLN